MRKFLIFVVFLGAAYFGYKYMQNRDTQYVAVSNMENGEVVAVPPQFDVTFEQKLFKYTPETVKKPCTSKSDVVCIIDLAVRCTIEPNMQVCDQSRLPRFIFMEDSGLDRPTHIDFQVVKVKPIDMYTIEVYTQGTCNANWFGLCNGNIIYVLENKDYRWSVKDIYALDKI